MESRVTSACSCSSDQPSVPAGLSGILMNLQPAHAKLDALLTPPKTRPGHDYHLRTAHARLNDPYCAKRNPISQQSCAERAHLVSALESQIWMVTS